MFHDAGGVYDGPDEPYLFGRLRVSGPDPERRSYRSFASFSDPDGNGWLFQEVTTRLPGRIDSATTTFASANDLASAFRRAEAAHGEHEKRTGASATRTGPTGTRRTWWRSRPAKNCRNERLQLIAQLRVCYAMHHRYRPGDYETRKVRRARSKGSVEEHAIVSTIEIVDSISSL